MLGMSLSLACNNILSSGGGGGGGVSTATLTTGTGSTGAGTNRSHWVNATSYTATLNANVGVNCTVRANQAASHTKFQVEATLTYGANGDTLFLGFDDGTTDCDQAGSGWFTQGKDPGNAAGGGAKPGFLMELTQGQTAPAYSANGGVSNLTVTALATGQIFTLDVDTVANTILIKQNGTTITTITLTSQIPSTWWLMTGGNNLNDSMAINFGQSAYSVALPGSYSYY